MKYPIVCLLAVWLISCSKDSTSSGATLLTRYKWYAFEADIYTQYEDENNPSNVQTVAMDTCTQKSYYDFTSAGNVTRKLPCLHDEATGTWTLSEDSTFAVSIPYKSTNVGFISVNSSLKLASIDRDEMTTSYFSKIATSSNGGTLRIGTITTITTYKHY